MRKLLVFIAAVTLFACGRQQEGFKIKIEIEGAEGSILLEKRGGQNLVPVDTAEIKDGVAVLEGETDYPQDYYLSLEGDQNKSLVFVENENMTITGEVDSMANLKVTGSKTHSEFNEINTTINAVGAEYTELYQQARQAIATGDTTRAWQLMDQVNKMVETTIVLQKEYIEENPGSYVSPYFLANVQDRLEVNELDELVTSLEPHLDTLQIIENLKNRIERLKKVAIGATAPDFTMNDPEGNPVKFSDVYSRNDLTLLDFWAGWCGPCRAENPNVVAVYNDYKDEGFTVFGVSLDRTKDAWLKAIEEDRLTWTNVSDLAYWNNAAADLYEVNSIPAGFLVDRSGKILAKNKKGDELRAAVSEILK